MGKAFAPWSSTLPPDESSTSNDRPMPHPPARKRLGQNFLIDAHLPAFIAEAAEISREDLVIEVGPGLGILTAELAARAGRVLAVEIDERLITELERRFAGDPHVRILQADILQVPPAQLLPPGAHRYKVVANLPYYITSPVLMHFLEANPPPELMVVMVQREVAERLAAQPPDLSLLGVAAQVYGRPTILRRVPPGAFRPVPKVSSAVVRIDLYDRPSFAPLVARDFFPVVRAGFGQPRKQLQNSLASGLDLTRQETTAWLTRAAIDGKRRAETLQVEEWVRLAGTRLGASRARPETTA